MLVDLSIFHSSVLTKVEVFELFINRVAFRLHDRSNHHLGKLKPVFLKIRLKVCFDFI